jgi:hypothetical protein
LRFSSGIGCGRFGACGSGGRNNKLGFRLSRRRIRLASRAASPRGAPRSGLRFAAGRSGAFPAEDDSEGRACHWQLYFWQIGGQGLRALIGARKRIAVFPDPGECRWLNRGLARIGGPQDLNSRSQTISQRRDADHRQSGNCHKQENAPIHMVPPSVVPGPSGFVLNSVAADGFVVLPACVARSVHAFPCPYPTILVLPSRFLVISRNIKN